VHVRACVCFVTLEGRGRDVGGSWRRPPASATKLVLQSHFVWVLHGLLGGIVGAAGAVEVSALVYKN
jgi:hypothetical protein